MTRVLVTGASGLTGRLLLPRLRVPGLITRAATRTALPGVDEHVHFEWTDPSTHARALADVDRVYLLGPGLVVDVASVVIPFVERALHAGVQRFVMLSASAVPKGAPGLGRVHAFLETHAPQWTILQPSWFMQNLLDPRHHLASGVRTGRLTTATGHGRVGLIDADDIAAVAARALLDHPAHDTAHVLTGPAALSYDEVAETLSRVHGRPITHAAVDPTTLVRILREHDVPEAYATLLAALDTDIAAGKHDYATDTVLRVTGDPPRSLETMLRRSDSVYRCR